MEGELNRAWETFTFKFTYNIGERVMDDERSYSGGFQMFELNVAAKRFVVAIVTATIAVTIAIVVVMTFVVITKKFKVSWVSLESLESSLFTELHRKVIQIVIQILVLDRELPSSFLI